MSKGCVYILTNPCIRSLEGKEVVKVGFTKDMPKRLGTLNTSVPENFKVAALFEVENYKDLEKWSKAYIGESIKTKDGSSTEFFEKTVDEVVEQIKKCCRHHGVKPKKLDGAVYVGRSSSAIRKNLAKPCNGFASVSQLARVLVERNNGRGRGGLEAILNRRRSVMHGKWRVILTECGLSFDNKGLVIDWRKARV